jgi:hypothetical protein
MHLSQNPPLFQSPFHKLKSNHYHHIVLISHTLHSRHCSRWWRPWLMLAVTNYHTSSQSRLRLLRQNSLLERIHCHDNTPLTGRYTGRDLLNRMRNYNIPYSLDTSRSVEMRGVIWGRRSHGRHRAGRWLRARRKELTSWRIRLGGRGLVRSIERVRWRLLRIYWSRSRFVGRSGSTRGC